MPNDPLLGSGDAVLAFDVGGTFIKAALVDESGAVLELVRVPTPPSGPSSGEAVVASVVRLAAELCAAHPSVTPRAAGLLVPGHVDDARGIGIGSENLGWSNVPFRQRAEELLELPIAFGHDVRVAGEAEFRVGAAAPFRNVVVIAIGHAKVSEGPECVCGGFGCLEAVASASAIARIYTKLSGHAVSGAETVVRLAAAGDQIAVDVWNAALDALALALSHTSCLLAPEAIVIGGGLSRAGTALFDPLHERLSALLTSTRNPLLLPAAIGDDAGVIGAALRARDLVAALEGSPSVLPIAGEATAV